MIQEQTIHFPSIKGNIAIVEKLIDDICADYEINEDYYGNILVALTEAVNNAILHGNKSNPDKKVSVTFGADDNGLSFVIKDEGDGFDYKNIPDPTSPKNIENPNGRGVFLMRQLADEISFKDNGRMVSMKFKTAN